MNAYIQGFLCSQPYNIEISLSYPTRSDLSSVTVVPKIITKVIMFNPADQSLARGRLCTTGFCLSHADLCVMLVRRSFSMHSGY